MAEGRSGTWRFVVGALAGLVLASAVVFAFVVYSALADQTPAVESVWIRGRATESRGPGESCVETSGAEAPMCGTLRLAPGAEAPQVGGTYWFLGVEVVDDNPFSTRYWLTVSEER